MRNIKEIYLHCTATRENQNYTVEQIRKWHVEGNHWKDIGYHYVIYIDGSINEGRPIEQVGAHCSGHNAESIGIVYVGGLTKDGKSAKDTRTDEQKESLYKLVSNLMKQYNIKLDNVHCHNEFASKSCPCFTIDQFKDELAKWKDEQYKQYLVEKNKVITPITPCFLNTWFMS